MGVSDSALGSKSDKEKRTRKRKRTKTNASGIYEDKFYKVRNVVVPQLIAGIIISKEKEGRSERRYMSLTLLYHDKGGNDVVAERRIGLFAGARSPATHLVLAPLTSFIALLSNG